MTELAIRSIVLVLVLGIGAQWLAWRIRIPSILLLLTVGFVAGPVTGLLDPASLQGDWVFAFVSLSIGIILFEGGLSLRLSELREVGKAVRNLITVGVLITWVLASLGAYYIAGLPTGLAIQLGAILTVTGPTVVIPLLRHVRPKGRVGAIAKWEGITIDPAGAILAVLVLEAILLIHASPAAANLEGSFGEAAFHAVQGLLLTIAISVGISVLGAGTLILLLHRRLVPDYLQNAVALMMVVGVFALSNTLQAESGLLEATLMGIIMANQKYVPVRRIVEFKENLQVLLIGSLFIILSARLNLDALDYIDGPALLFLGLLILVVRPVAVVFSSFGTGLNWREQAFLSWLAPRGIVAAAVASLFSFELQAVYPQQAESLVPLIFLAIVSTVAVYGLTLPPLARYLRLADPDPQGLLFLGAHPWAQQMALLLRDLGVRVLLIDANVKNIELARQHGLPAVAANVLSESEIDQIDLDGIGRFLAMTENDEVNTLASLMFAEMFDSKAVFQLDARHRYELEHLGEGPSSLRGRPLFGPRMTYAQLERRFEEGGEIRAVTLTEDIPYEAVQTRYGQNAIPLFVLRGQEVHVFAEEGQAVPETGDTLILFTPPLITRKVEREAPLFETLVTQAFLIDAGPNETFAQIVHQASSWFALRLPITADRLADGFLEIARSGAMPVAHGMALPHYRLSVIEEPKLVMVRCREGIPIEVEDTVHERHQSTQPVHAVFFLVSPEDHPERHLHTLAQLAGRIDDPTFLNRWLSATDEQELKETLLHPDHALSLVLSSEDATAAFIDRQVKDLDLPEPLRVALLGRNHQVSTPKPDTRLREGDRITLIGSTIEIRRLRLKMTSED